MPGEPRETVELGLVNAPREGLYLREDVDMKCNIVMSGFVKKTLKKAHAVLVDRLVVKADILKEQAEAEAMKRQDSTRSRDLYYNRQMSPISPPVSFVGSPDPNLRYPSPLMNYENQDVKIPGFSAFTPPVFVHPQYA